MIQSPSSPQDNLWQTLTEISVANEPWIVQKTAEMVMESVRSLRLPTALAESLKIAVSDAILDEIELRPDLPVMIKVMVSDGATSLQIIDDGIGGSVVDQEPSNLKVKMEDLQPMRGWGFFFIEKMVDEQQIINGEANHTIQLFLYLEGK